MKPKVDEVDIGQGNGCTQNITSIKHSHLKMVHYILWSENKLDEYVMDM